ncbi:ATP-dependent DNA helicase [Streptomyces sp. TS71-3]|uniref:ATP-dependent DNA helicase n=1 Tax=Streptomyces sp. TS71-3 TaxID=2733862 RepID=UPI001BB405C7|nr:ATP-dependent DNA helicase [Streptomyces sp. TS71-3]
MNARITDPEQLKELLGIPFTPEQTACITAPPAPQVIVAGAGSGKTTVMAARVVWLVGTGQVTAEQVLGLTFTNKAAGELTERVRAALARAGVTDPDPAVPGEAGEPVISTYHAFAGRLLADHGLRIGLEPTTRLLADATRFQLAARVLREAPGPYPALTRSFPDLVSDLLALDAELAEHLVEPARLRAHDTDLLRTLGGAKLTNADLRKVPEAAGARRELTELVGRYRAAKRERDLVDFGDQIALSAALARTRPEVGAILRDEFRVVLLDEYQDTSVAQRVLLAALFGGGTGHPVTAVGDPCQAIYGWRGASVANLDDFPEHFAHPDGRPARRHALSENRRSGGRLLDLANTLATPLRALHTGVQALRPAPGAERDGTVRCALLTTHAEEIDWLADSLAHLVATGTPPGEIAVLCRTAADFPGIQKALVARDVPVEVVGLSGLLHLPEVADLVAVCEVLQDPGANASLVRLLIGPRWRIGPRDLALLGRRARVLVRREDPAGSGDADRRLAEAVEGVDPAEVTSLADALDTFLESPFEAEPEDDGLPFSPDARVRFAHLAAELRELRRSLSDPLMDVLHRVLTYTGLEVELSASPHALAARRRETLSNFLDVAASFAAHDSEATLLAFLGFLRTAAQYEKGLDAALPGGENTVKVLTAHKSKGLEWDVVAVPGLVTGTFPSTQGREKWTAQGKVIPHALRGDAATLPDVAAFDSKGLKAFQEAMKDHQHTEELRLGYVTFTRPRNLLLGSGHWWGPTQKKPRGPSEFLAALYEHCAEGHGEIEAWADEPEEGAQNPVLAREAAGEAWPLPLDPAALRLRRAAAARVLAHLEGPQGPQEPPEAPAAHVAMDVREAADVQVSESRAADPTAGESPEPDPAGVPGAPGVPGTQDAPAGLTPEEARAVASWDRDLGALTGELLRSREAVTEIALPPSLTATELVRLAADPDGFARDLARPMPRPPRPAARRGTRFHAWVEARFEALRLPLPDTGELPGDDEPPGHDAEIDDERDLEALKEAFERTPYAHRTPHRVEAPFQIVLAGRVVRGRIDAVYRDGDAPEAAYEIVDWKTGRSRGGARGDGAGARAGGGAVGGSGPMDGIPYADPLQLAIYRLAWAEQHGIPVESVRAVFVHVRSGRTVRPRHLPGRAELERILLEGTPRPDGSALEPLPEQPEEAEQPEQPER